MVSSEDIVAGDSEDDEEDLKVSTQPCCQTRLMSPGNMFHGNSKFLFPIPTLTLQNPIPAR